MNTKVKKASGKHFFHRWSIDFSKMPKLHRFWASLFLPRSYGGPLPEGYSHFGVSSRYSMPYYSFFPASYRGFIKGRYQQNSFLGALASGQRRSVWHALSSAPVFIQWELRSFCLFSWPSYIAGNWTALRPCCNLHSAAVHTFLGSRG